MTVGDFRDWLLAETTTTEVLARLAPGLTPEMVAAVSKIMRNQDLILAAKKVEVVTRSPRHHRPQGPHVGARASRTTRRTIPRASPPPCVDGLMYGCGDAVIGINPASDNVNAIISMLKHAG